MNVDPPASSQKSTLSAGRPLIYGEVVFDHLPDGQAVLGGAPFNVAWNLCGLGLDPLFVSGIGDDSFGKQIGDRMKKWGLDPTGLQVIPERPSGTVEITVLDGQPQFKIHEDQAYDHVTFDQSLLDRGFSLFYCGTLAYRSKTTRETLRSIFEYRSLQRFVDINIRDPHFEVDWLDEILPDSTWVKVNDDELQRLTGICADDQTGIEKAVRKLQTRYGEITFFVTCGSRGAYAIGDFETSFAPAPVPNVFCDSVGAGDAFAASVIHGLYQHKPIGELLKDATTFASKICGINGATSTNRTLYQS